VKKIKWKDLEIGAIVTEPGSAAQYKTGDWRTEKPVRENSKCMKCGICYIFCPEGCIYMTEEGYFDADLCSTARDVASALTSVRKVQLKW